MRITVSLLDPNNWQEYKVIRLEALKENPEAFGSTYEKEVNYSSEEWQARTKDKDILIFIAKDSIAPIGMVGIHRKVQSEGVTAHLWGMFVKKNHRGMGIGKRLLQQAIEVARENKEYSTITLDVNPSQTAAVQLYHLLGFKPSGTRMYRMGDSKDHELLSMKLEDVV